jgi:outer membrane lipoprotein-sorting protein
MAAELERARLATERITTRGAIGMSRAIRLAGVCVALLLAHGNGWAAENELGWTLDSALKQIERQSKDFDSLLSEVTAVRRDAQGEELGEVSGRMYMNKNGDLRVRFDDGSDKQMLITRGEIQEYDPAQQLAERYNLNKHKHRIEPYARLGFTTTGRDLKSDFLVTMRGEEVIGGQRTLVLQMTPKREQTRQIVSSATIWIDEASWMPIRQVIERAENGETLTFDYSGMARNLPLNPDLFKSSWPSGTKRINR